MDDPDQGNASPVRSSSRFRDDVDAQRRIRARARAERPFWSGRAPEALLIVTIVVLAWINAAFVLL